MLNNLNNNRIIVLNEGQFIRPLWSRIKYKNDKNAQMINHKILKSNMNQSINQSICLSLNYT